MSSSIETNRWYDGTGLPSEFLGGNCDYYIQMSNSDVFRKMENVWIRIGNIKGEKGKNGLKGEKGDTGENGENGSRWYTGVGLPSSKLGIEKDFYIDLISKDIFEKSLDSWLAAGSLLPDGRKVELIGKDGDIKYRYEGEGDADWKILVNQLDIKGDMPSISHLETLINDKIIEIDSVADAFIISEETRISNENVRISSEATRQQSMTNMQNTFNGLAPDQATNVEVQLARTDATGKEHASLKVRLDMMETNPNVIWETVEG